MTLWPHHTASSETARFITTLAENQSLRFNHYFTEPEHFLLAIVCLENDLPCLAAVALNALLGDLRPLRQETEKRMESHPCMRMTSESPPSSVTLNALKNAVNCSHRIGEIPTDFDGYGSGGLLLGIASCPNSIAQTSLVYGCQLKLADIEQTLIRLLATHCDTSKPFIYPADRLPMPELLVSLFVKGISLENLFERFPSNTNKIAQEVNLLISWSELATTAELWAACQLFCDDHDNGQLHKAIANQDFERAAMIRDQITREFPRLSTLHKPGYSVEQLLESLSRRIGLPPSATIQ